MGDISILFEAERRLQRETYKEGEDNDLAKLVDLEELSDPGLLTVLSVDGDDMNGSLAVIETVTKGVDKYAITVEEDGSEIKVWA